MKKYRLLIIMAVVLFGVRLSAVNYIMGAESVSWNGSYTSVADSFQALLYNPAGIYMTDRKFGLIPFTSAGFRFYNNTFSTDDVINLLTIMGSNDRDISDIIFNKLNLMPEFGLDAGFDASMLNYMMYMNLKNFGLGFFINQKAYVTSTIGKSIFSTLFDNLNLREQIDISLKSTYLQYMDFGVALSTRVPFLEKHLNIKNIYAGITGHFYLPLVYTNFSSSVGFGKGEVDETTGFYKYGVDIQGDFISSVNPAISEIFKLVDQVKEIDLITSVLNNSSSFSFGLGVDMGFMLKFNRIIRYGFSINDLGFFYFPNVGIAELSYTTEFNPTRIQEFGKNFVGDLQNQISTSLSQKTEGTWYMPQTTIRTGIAVEPIRNRFLNLIVATDLSVTDFQRLIDGNYATFNFSTGIEIAPRVSVVEFPFRMAISYNSQANYASLSFGTGFYLGPAQFEIAIKGLEFLIKDWGTKEFNLGFDFRLEF